MGVEMISGEPIIDLTIENQILTEIHSSTKTYLDGDFFFTIPTIFMPPLLKNRAPDPANKLEQIEYFGAICVILEMNRPLSEIYWLNIADPDFPFGGIIEQTNLVSPSNYNGKHIAYLSRYFAHSDLISKMSMKKFQN